METQVLESAATLGCLIQSSFPCIIHRGKCTFRRPHPTPLLARGKAEPWPVVVWGCPGLSDPHISHMQPEQRVERESDAQGSLQWDWMVLVVGGAWLATRMGFWE